MAGARMEDEQTGESPAPPVVQQEGEEEEDDEDEEDFKYDLFLSHLQRNGQDAIISMRMLLEKAHPNIRIFTDLEVDMNKGGGLTATLMDAVRNTRALVFFITDGIFKSEWCVKEIRQARDAERIIVLVRETDPRHGAIAMNEVFHQAPEDLIPLLLEIRAIPWYRQPASRDASIQSILKAAKYTGAFDRGMQRLQNARTRLEEVSKGAGITTTAFEVISKHSLGMRVVFFVGGFARFRSCVLNTLYVLLFGCSFWFCGALCCANLYFQSTPYHVISTDMLTAYVHLPAWQSWLFWHGFVRTDGCAELMSSVMNNERTAEIVKIAVRVAGCIVLVLQVSMVAVVLAGFSLPGTLGYSPHAAWSGVLPLHAGGETFTLLHYAAMWAVIPPVIAAMFASYSMFAFVSLLHFLDVKSLKHTATECTAVLTRFYEQRAAETSRAWKRGRTFTQEIESRPSQGLAAMDSLSVTSSNLDDRVEDMQDSAAHQEEEEAVCKGVIDMLDMLVRRVQARVDFSSRKFSGLWVHLVLFSTCQVLAITNGLRSHVRDNEGLNSVPYTWWWAFQDFFHLGGGIVLLTTAMVVLCAVTTALQAIPIGLLEILRDAGCPLAKVGSAHGLLAARPLGMHILRGTVYMDVPKAAAFLLVLLVHVLSTAMAVANRLDYHKK